MLVGSHQRARIGGRGLAAKARSRRSRPDGNPAEILAVDDHPPDLKLARVMLEAYGYGVRVAADAEAALVVLRKFRPRLILLDLTLPGRSGLEFVQELKARPALRDVAIVALTVDPSKRGERAARAAGCIAYLAKPVPAGVLVDLVASIIGSRDDPR